MSNYFASEGAFPTRSVEIGKFIEEKISRIGEGAFIARELRRRHLLNRSLAVVMTTIQRKSPLAA
jgi:hypothetical protein